MVPQFRAVVVARGCMASREEVPQTACFVSLGGYLSVLQRGPDSDPEHKCQIGDRQQQRGVLFLL